MGAGGGGAGEGVRSDDIVRTETTRFADGVDVGWERKRHPSGCQSLGWKPLEASGSQGHRLRWEGSRWSRQEGESWLLFTASDYKENYSICG